MRKISFVISEHLLKEALHIPDDCEIIAFSTDEHGGYCDLKITAFIPGVIGETERPEELKVTPSIHFEPEKYTWFWNLPA